MPSGWVGGGGGSFLPDRSVAEYTHGQVVPALVANRLTHPRPLSSFEEWGEKFAVQETLGLASCKLNDDRLGRTLDALAEHLAWLIWLKIASRSYTE